MTPSPARLALDALLAELAPREPSTGWTWDDVYQLDLTDAQIATIIEAEPHDLQKALANPCRVGEVAHIYREPFLGDRTPDIGCHFSAIIGVAAMDTLLEELRLLSLRREGVNEVFQLGESPPLGEVQ